MVTTERTWGGTTLAERKAERRAALIKAAIELTGERGTTGLTTKSICDRAGLIERYLYESFGSRDELLLAAFDDVIQRGLVNALGRFAADLDADLTSRLRVALSSTVDLALEEPGAFRLIFVDSAGDPVLRERFQGLQTSLATAAAHALAELGDGTPDPKALPALAVAAAGAAVSLLTSWMNKDLDLTQEELVDLSVGVMFSIMRTH